MKCERCGRDVSLYVATPHSGHICFNCVNYNGGVEICQSFVDWSDAHDCAGCVHYNGFNEWGPNCSQCARSKSVSDFYEVVE
jgi:hypothetical protein